MGRIGHMKRHEPAASGEVKESEMSIYWKEFKS